MAAESEPPAEGGPPDGEDAEHGEEEEEATAAKKAKLPEEIEAERFEALEAGFQDVVAQLVADKGLEHFRVEYEKLFRAVKKSHESEKRLLRKCRELNQEIVDNSEKVDTALKMSQADEDTIGELKTEITRAWAMVETAHEKESQAKSTISTLKGEIANLNKLVEQGAIIARTQEAAVSTLKKEREDLLNSKVSLQKSAEELSGGNAELLAKLETIEGERSEGQLEITSLRELNTSKKNEVERQQRALDRVQKDLGELKQTQGNLAENLGDQATTFEMQRERSALIEQQLKEQNRILEKLQVQEKLLTEELKRNEKAFAGAVEAKDDQLKTNMELKHKIKKLQESLRISRQESEKADRLLADAKRAKRLDESKFRELVTTKEQFVEDVKEIIKEIDRMHAYAQKDDNSLNKLLHERDLLNRAMIKTDERSKLQMERVKIFDAAADASRAEIDKWKQKVTAGLKKIEELDRAREKLGLECNAQNQKYFQTLDQIKGAESKATDLRKNYGDLRGKLNQQKELYQQVRSDRNGYSRALIESQDEISEMKRKFKIMFHQIEQLKEEIKEKDEALKRETIDYDRKKRECVKRKEEAAKAKKKQQELTQLAELENEEIKKLEHRIHDFESTRLAQKQEYEEVVAERDLLGTQLIRRNDELALLYEKVKIQFSTLENAENVYKDLEEDIRNLKIEHRNVQREAERSKRKGSSLDEVKRTIYILQRELLHERTKVKALSEELENPMNMQRWRKLDGSDPAMYEMIQKVKTLQKRLIHKTEQSVNFDLMLQEKEKLYSELKDLVDKQPGPEVAAQVSAFQTYLKDITNQMKSVAAELNMCHAQMTDYRDEVEKAQHDLQETKRKYFDQKRRNQLFSNVDG
mmetsp:Transcript_9055/g.22157  ORF Transcript_9055/g.22157 Transcript_9055/m.22157 type:complete len:871 (+) Transcript_9055:181-2793(+)